MKSNNKSMHNQDKISILFLCTGNSCRSQIAEGYTRTLKGDLLDAYSAGIEARGLDPLAIEIMAEDGIDLGGQTSKTTGSLVGKKFDFVVTLCEDAETRCPYFPAQVAVIHRGFDDPPKCAKSATSREEKLACYRKVRDEIKAFIETMPQSLRK